MRDKKKRKKIYLISFGIFIFIIIFVNFILIFIPEEDSLDKSHLKQGDDFVNHVTCTYTDPEDIHFKIELTLKENFLQTKTEETTWEDKESSTCAFYTKRVEVFNSIKGVKDTVDCDDTKGKRITIYNFDDLDKKEANIAELRYMNEDNTFDVDSYISYRNAKGYRCVKKWK